jgi:hypothetical protein
VIVQDSERQSLEQIEGDYWGDPPAEATRLVATVHELRRRPVGALGVEDLRVLIGQRVGLDALVPPALARLEADPLAEGDFYPGDLLSAVVRLPVEYWRAHPTSAARLRAVIAAVDPGEADDELLRDIAGFPTTEY